MPLQHGLSSSRGKVLQGQQEPRLIKQLGEGAHLERKSAVGREAGQRAAAAPAGLVRHDQELHCFMGMDDISFETFPLHADRRQ